MLENSHAYLLQNQVNPFPIAGDLVLDDGRLRFTLNASAGGASLGWLEKALELDDLKGRIANGERPVVFDLAVKDTKISWPVSLARIGMKIEAPERKWIVSMEQPNSGPIFQTLSLLEGKRRYKDWREAIDAAS